MNSGANAFCHENRCLDRLMLETTMSSMNRALRNSDGTSIIVRGLPARKQKTRNATVVMALQTP